MLDSIPVKAADSFAFLINNPTRKTPKTGPLKSEAIDKAWSSAERFCFITTSATAIWTKPMTSVSQPEIFNKCRSDLSLANGLYKSLTNVAAIEFKDEESAAAKIAAITSPDKPEGIYFVIKSGKTLSPPANGNVAGTPEFAAPASEYSGELNGA